MGRDTRIADKLRAADLDVVEVAGWQVRGSDSFDPQGFVWHHTAGPSRGNAPSLGVCTNGRPGLSGPLCNVFLARDGVVYVVAAGRANHAGAGNWGGLSGNRSVYGLEIENIGTSAEPWKPFILDRAAQIAAALISDHHLCCMHKEWAPRRKVDMHTVSGRDMRARVAMIHNGHPLTPPVSWPDLTGLGVPTMFLTLEGVGLFAMIEGNLVQLAPAEYDQARKNSIGVPTMWLTGKAAREMHDKLN